MRMSRNAISNHRIEALIVVIGEAHMRAIINHLALVKFAIRAQLAAARHREIHRRRLSA